MAMRFIFEDEDASALAARILSGLEATGFGNVAQSARVAIEEAEQKLESLLLRASTDLESENTMAAMMILFADPSRPDTLSPEGQQFLENFTLPALIGAMQENVVRWLRDGYPMKFPLDLLESFIALFHVAVLLPRFFMASKKAMNEIGIEIAICDESGRVGFGNSHYMQLAGASQEFQHLAVLVLKRWNPTLLEDLRVRISNNSAAPMEVGMYGGVVRRFAIISQELLSAQ